MDIRDVFLRESFEPVFEFSGNTGNGLSRNECEAISQEAYGSTTPPRNIKAIIHTADDKWFLLLYFKTQDKFLFEKLTPR